jgi:hypothetical protein
MFCLTDFTLVYIGKYLSVGQIERYIQAAAEAGAEHFAVDFNNRRRINKVVKVRVVCGNLYQVYIAKKEGFETYYSNKAAAYTISKKLFCKHKNTVYWGFSDILKTDYKAAFAKMKYSEFIPSGGVMQSAAAIEFAVSGGEKIGVAFGGTGGHAAFEQTAAALCIMLRADYRLNALTSLKEVFEEITGIRQSPNAPVTGNNIFNVSSGIHSDGINKNPLLYQPYLPEKAGRKNNTVLTAASSASVVVAYACEKGFTLNIKQAQKALSLIKQAAQEGYFSATLADKIIVEVNGGINE